MATLRLVRKRFNASISDNFAIMDSNLLRLIGKLERQREEEPPQENREFTSKMEVALTTLNLTRYMQLILEFRR